MLPMIIMLLRLAMDVLLVLAGLFFFLGAYPWYVQLLGVILYIVLLFVSEYFMENPYH